MPFRTEILKLIALVDLIEEVKENSGTQELTWNVEVARYRD